MTEAYVKARDIGGVERRITSAAISLRFEYDKNVLIAHGTRADVLGTLDGDGYTVYHCTIGIEHDERGYKIILQDLPPQTDVRQMKLRKKEVEQFLREIER